MKSKKERQVQRPTCRLPPKKNVDAGRVNPRFSTTPEVPIYEHHRGTPALPFTEQGKEALHKLLEAYKRKLVGRSRRIASSSDLDVVSECHVNQADSTLNPREARKRYLGAVGGLVAGGSLSTLLPMFVNGNIPDPTAGILLLALLMAGVVAIVFDLNHP